MRTDTEPHDNARRRDLFSLTSQWSRAESVNVFRRRRLIKMRKTTVGGGAVNIYYVYSEIIMYASAADYRRDLFSFCHGGL